MEKAVEDLKVQIQDLQEGMQSSSIHAVSQEEFVTFQDRVLSMLARLESRVEVLTKNEEKFRQEVAIYKTALSAWVMATHEAPRVEVPKPHTFSGKQNAMTGVQKTTATQMGEKRCPVVLPGMGRARCPTLGKIKASASNGGLRQS